MWSVHPDAFQYALTPIPRDGVVGIGVVPIDGEGTAVENRPQYDPGGKEMFPPRGRSPKRLSDERVLHKTCLVEQQFIGSTVTAENKGTTGRLSGTSCAFCVANRLRELR